MERRVSTRGVFGLRGVYRRESIPVERRVSTRGVFGWRGVSRREEYSGGEACLDERSIPVVDRRVFGSSMRAVGLRRARRRFRVKGQGGD